MITDFLFVVRWWSVLFAIGLLFFPLTKILFKNSKDHFYIFSKILGIGIVSYCVLFLGTFHILAFSLPSILFTLCLFFLLNILLYRKTYHTKKFKFKISKIIIFEEVLFFLCLCIWAFIRSHEPSIHGLEKFMDYGFINSILRTSYFPPRDMWFTPFSINYYFFGHLCTAVLTRVSSIPSNVAYNLMLATLFSFTFVGGFSLLYNFLYGQKQKIAILGGLLGGTTLSLSGNLQILYSFFAGYNGEHPVAPWKLAFTPLSFPNNYWYPNATRFIPFTIHEFPLYSFVVSDLHGHVTDIPFVLLTIALLFTTLKNRKLTIWSTVFLSLLLAMMYMTNVWDGIIYLLLTCFVLLVINFSHLTFKFKKKRLISIHGLRRFLEEMILQGGLIVILYAIFTIPFSLSFKPFVSGIGILCTPKFLTAVGKFGPFLFEADHCQKSPFYQLVILYGFFYFFVFCFVVFFINKKFNNKPRLKNLRTSARSITKGQMPALHARHSFSGGGSILEGSRAANVFVFLLILLATLLIIIPEFIYAKDIYPQHYRANTMFKLVYQSFIMLSLASSYIIIFLSQRIKNIFFKILFLLITFLLLVLIFLYPYFAVKSYYNDLKIYTGLDGTAYLKTLYAGDLEAINFLNEVISGQPVVLEAQGDSYTDYARISSNTGLPTVLGWTVHEWLWRGTYDVPAPRITEVKTMYEGNETLAVPLLKKYKVEYVVIGPLEHQKYPALNEEKFNNLGKVIFKSTDGLTKIITLER